jgi:phospholipase C
MANLSRIEHVVVLMLENRSFDNVFGWLYDPANPSPFNVEPPPNFEGVYGKKLSNPGLKGNVPVGKGQTPTDPYPDPGEQYEDVYQQLYNEPTVALKDVPPPPAASPSMKGFVNNYARRNGQNAEIIMNCFTPATLPVLSTLALNYAVCDHWFCSIPSQTLCNRSFVQAGTSSGYVDNQGDGLIFVNKTPTIYNFLTDAKKTWRVYTAGWTATSLVMITQEKVWDYVLQPGYFRFLHDFETDAQRPGGLPNYSFIEPNYMDSLKWGPESDMHPESHALQLYGVSNIEEGDNLVYRVYSAVRKSPDWEKTLLIIIFDEHGGCYDHVPPPTTIAPDQAFIEKGNPGYSGFKFDHLGVRVPAVVISPFTRAGMVLNDVYDHTTILKTVMECFGMVDFVSNKLGDRAAKAKPLQEAVKLDVPRQDLPVIPTPPTLEVSAVQKTLALGKWLLHASEKPVTDLHKAALSEAAHRLGRADLVDQAQNAKSAFDAESVAMRVEVELWKRRHAKSPLMSISHW